LEFQEIEEFVGNSLGLHWLAGRCRSQIDFLPDAGDGDELGAAEQVYARERFRALKLNDA